MHTQSNVISIPSSNRLDSFEEGSKQARLAIETRQDYMLAYSMAVADSVFKNRPQEYLHGFVITFRAEEEKRSFA